MDASASGARQGGHVTAGQQTQESIEHHGGVTAAAMTTDSPRGAKALKSTTTQRRLDAVVNGLHGVSREHHAAPRDGPGAADTSLRACIQALRVSTAGGQR